MKHSIAFRLARAPEREREREGGLLAIHSINELSPELPEY